jgi:hypothetical protein
LAPWVCELASCASSVAARSSLADACGLVLLQLVAAVLLSGARLSAAAGSSRPFRRNAAGTLMAAEATLRSCDVSAASIALDCLLTAAVALDLRLRGAPTVAFESARRLSADVVLLLAGLGADSGAGSERRRIADAARPARRGSVCREEDSAALKTDASVPSDRKAARTKMRVRVLDRVRGKVGALQLAAASDPNAGGSAGSFVRRRAGPMSLRCRRRVRIALVPSDGVAVGGFAKQRLEAALRFASMQCSVRVRNDAAEVEGFAMKRPGCAGQAQSDAAVAPDSASKQLGADRARMDAAASADCATRARSFVSKQRAGTVRARSDAAAVVGFAKLLCAPARTVVARCELMPRHAACAGPAPDRAGWAPNGAVVMVGFASSTRADTGRTARRLVHGQLVAALPSQPEAAKKPPRFSVAMRRLSRGLVSQLMAAQCVKRPAAPPSATTATQTPPEQTPRCARSPHPPLQSSPAESARNETPPAPTSRENESTHSAHAN